MASSSSSRDITSFLSGLRVDNMVQDWVQNNGYRGNFAQYEPRARNGGPSYNESASGCTIRRKGEDDIKQFQYWPSAMAMGASLGTQFQQMIGGATLMGPEESPSNPGKARSYFAFDFVRELFLVRALRPIYFELSFDDIASQGIHLDYARSQVIEYGTARHVPGFDVTMTINVRRPPKFYTAFRTRENDMYGGGRGTSRRRATAMDFSLNETQERNAGPISPIPTGPAGYPTYWRTYRWIFNLPERKANELRDCIRKIGALAQSDANMDLLAHSHRRWTVMHHTTDSFDREYVSPDLSKVKFSSRTLMEGLVAHGIILPGELAKLVEALRVNAVVPAFRDRILESLYSEERIRNIPNLINRRAAFLRRSTTPTLNHLVMIRTVLVTPTRMLIGPPQQEPSNSVTRRYAEKLDGIIRVVFTDEEDRLFVGDYTKMADEADDKVGPMARVRRALQHGLRVGGNLFMPVASSASQQKEHAIWFIDARMIDGLELRNWMGTVAETVVAKHAARMGLPFSTSRSINLNVTVGPVEPDIERNGFTFTDGVGFAGVEVMKEAAKALGTTQGINATPSTVQFRLGGAKGVLACWPDRVGPHEVRLRKSNIKFESGLTDLNVVRIAKYQVAFLNRQFIIIMNALGIPEELFVEIFHDAVRDIKGLRDRVRLQQTNRGDKRLIGSCSEFPLATLIKAGFHEDPLVLDICSIIECRALQDLKWRARVPLPGGVFLIGISDETGLLREGEVFCQYQENEANPAVIVQSEIIICRAPALHPGDIRRAWAVDVPELRHLKNVIVFSTQGARDLPNMLGGGDLDGDDYTLIWDQRFVKPLQMYPPMDYKAPPPMRVDQVTQAHLNENFVQYILNDILGQVDNAHLALADKEGPFHADCLKLAETHSTAVDFAKTGHAARLEPGIKPKYWPDFMDKADSRNIYPSQGVLGQLFRIVQPDPHYRPSDIRDVGYPFDERLSELPIYGGLIKALKDVKADYEFKLQHDMRRYRVFKTEIPSGIAIRNKRRKRARDQNLNEPLRDAYNQHVRATRAAALEAAAPWSFKSKLSKEQIVALHCYALTYGKEYVVEWEATAGQYGGSDRVEEAMVNGEQVLRSVPMLSFAWVFWQELLQIVAMPQEQH